MREIIVVQFGKGTSAAVENTIIALNQIQRYFKFTLGFGTIVPKKKERRNGVYREEYLEELILNYRDEHHAGCYIIGICDFRLEEKLVKISTNEYSLISTFEVQGVLNHTRVSFLQFMIASVIIDLDVEVSYIHYATRGCPNDYCDDPADVNIGIERGEFCLECRRALLSAVETGKLPLPVLLATYRILDHVAGRKVCFVLMPFHEKFDKVYRCIKKTVENMGYYCIRADEIFETRSFITIVNEMIERAEVIIADLTDRNPNVFYELGYAHAFSKNTVLLAQETTDVPSDLRHRQYFSYSPTQKLAATIEYNLDKYLRT